MDLPDDFRDMLVELADAGAQFVVIGGYAVAFHGHPWATKDIDILIHPTVDNAARVYRALVAFGAPIESSDIAESDFVVAGNILQIGLPPNRIAIISGTEGVDFFTAAASGDGFSLDGRTIPVIGLEALLRNKRAVGRPQDLADVLALSPPPPVAAA